MTTKRIPPKLKSLINLLNDSLYHPGSWLGQQLGISRSAVWKYIHQLQQWGITLNVHKSKGYQLPQPIFLLDAQHIETELTTTSHPFQLEVLSHVNSTNDYLKSKIGTATNAIPFCLAEHQTAGRGRLGRTWISPFGTNLYLSCLWSFQQDLSELAGLSLVVGLAVIAALREQGLRDEIKIKWPNDILWQHKKLAGVLTEISAETYGYAQAIIGVGLNINMPVIPTPGINQDWTTVHAITGTIQDRNKLAALVIKQLLQMIPHFAQSGLKPFLATWRQHDALFDKVITLEHGNNQISGIGAGINTNGHLLLRHVDGTICSYSSGNTTIQK